MSRTLSFAEVFELGRRSKPGGLERTHWDDGIVTKKRLISEKTEKNWWIRDLKKLMLANALAKLANALAKLANALAKLKWTKLSWDNKQP